MSNIITRKNKKGKETKYSKVDSKMLNTFIKEGYGIEIDLSGTQQKVEEDAKLKLATPERDSKSIEDDEER